MCKLGQGCRTLAVQLHRSKRRTLSRWRHPDIGAEASAQSRVEGCRKPRRITGVVTRRLPVLRLGRCCRLCVGQLCIGARSTRARGDRQNICHKLPPTALPTAPLVLRIHMNGPNEDATVAGDWCERPPYVSMWIDIYRVGHPMRSKLASWQLTE